MGNKIRVFTPPDWPTGYSGLHLQQADVLKAKRNAADSRVFNPKLVKYVLLVSQTKTTNEDIELVGRAWTG